MRIATWACLALLLTGCAREHTDIAWIGQVRYANGDSALWARPSFDDSRWGQRRFWELPHPAGVMWIRVPIRLPVAAGADSAPIERVPRAVMVAALASHEGWWDGVLLGPGGQGWRGAAAEIPRPPE